MALLNDQLTVWEIGFRWAGFDPARPRLWLPLGARDNFRVIVDSILSGELDCLTLGIEKYAGNDAEVARYFIRYWIDEVYDCIKGRQFNRAFLRWAIVDRDSFRVWCERRRVPFPEFWFPPGWKLSYEWPDTEAYTVEESETVESLLAGLQPQPESAVEKEERLGARQRARAACQQIATVLWKENPEYTIAALIKHEQVLKYGGGSQFAEETVRRWMQEVAPEEVSKRRGRPTKEDGREDGKI